MKKLQHIFYQIPEYYLVIVVLLAGYKPPFYVAPIAIVGAALVLLQIIFSNHISGLILAGLLVVGSLFLLFAAISEFLEFPVANAEAYRLLLVGGALFIINIAMAAAMLKKYYFGLNI